MMVATEVRIAYFGALNGIEYKGITIPIFDEQVPMGFNLPKVDKADEVYILLQNQQTIDDSIQTVCHYRLISDITVKVVTKFTGTGRKIMCEEIASSVYNRIKSKRDISKLEGIAKIRCDVSRSIIETTSSETAFSKVMIFRNYVNK